MSDQIEQEVKPKRQYIKTGNARMSLWSDICKEHGIKNYRKDSPEYARARGLYQKALMDKKKGTLNHTTIETQISSQQKQPLDILYIDEKPIEVNQKNHTSEPVKSKEVKIKKKADKGDLKIITANE